MDEQRIREIIREEIAAAINATATVKKIRESLISDSVEVDQQPSELKK